MPRTNTPARKRTRQPRDDDGFVEMGVANPTALLEQIGSATPDRQFVRELSFNAFQAIANLGPGATGRVVWDVDWRRVHDTDGRERKLSITDTGCGMTPAEMRFYINNLAASGQETGRGKNMGVGAKIAAGYRNPLGVVYRSWKDGQGAQVVFRQNANGLWGLEPQRPGRSADEAYWLPLDDDDKPSLLRDLDHGTQVILLGDSAHDDTTAAPPSIELKTGWLTRTLNERFFTIPDGITLTVREGNQIKAGTARKRGTWLAGEEIEVLGQAAHLTRAATAKGSVAIDDAIVHWWLLDAESKLRTPLWASAGHRAALYKQELYDLPVAATRGGYTKVQAFGLSYGYDRVVLYVEPVDDGRVWPNQQRDRLVMAKQGARQAESGLPWQRYAEQFMAAMPPELADLQARAAEQAAKADQRPSIVARLKRRAHLLRVGVHHGPREPGRIIFSTSSGDLSHGTPSPDAPAGGKPAREQPSPRPEPATAPAAHPAAPATPEPTTPARPGEPDLDEQVPTIVWVSTDDDTRAPGHIEDAAGRYDAATNVLTLNADFRVYASLIAEHVDRFRNRPAAPEIVRTNALELFAQQLVEVVLTAQAMANSPRWRGEGWHMLVTEEALTAGVLPRYLLDEQLSKRNGQTFRKPTAPDDAAPVVCDLPSRTRVEAGASDGDDGVEQRAA